MSSNTVAVDRVTTPEPAYVLLPSDRQVVRKSIRGTGLLVLAALVAGCSENFGYGSYSAQAGYFASPNQFTPPTNYQQPLRAYSYQPPLQTYDAPLASDGTPASSSTIGEQLAEHAIEHVALEGAEHVIERSAGEENYEARAAVPDDAAAASDTRAGAAVSLATRRGATGEGVALARGAVAAGVGATGASEIAGGAAGVSGEAAGGAVLGEEVAGGLAGAADVAVGVGVAEVVGTALIVGGGLYLIWKHWHPDTAPTLSH